jgi:hypothetical protein
MEVMKTMIQSFSHLSESECHQGFVRQVRERMSSLTFPAIYVFTSVCAGTKLQHSFSRDMTRGNTSLIKLPAYLPQELVQPPLIIQA